jgi:phosphatidylserine/phosphatidylglycerophosphate/cardiolipin synthase-like enzyme
MVALVAVVVASGTGAAGGKPPRESIEDLVVRVGRARWTEDNAVELIDHPALAWRARVDLMENARHHLLISTFAWHNDEHGKRFRHLLQDTIDRRKAQGLDLDVRILADASTLGMFSRSFTALERHGARVRGYNRSSWGLTPVYDGRMHDKLFIVDGRTAILSGRNFADIYFDSRLWWLDLGVRLEGSSVDDLQMIFLKSWELTEFNRKAARFLLPQEMLLDDLRRFWFSGRYPNGNNPLQPFMNSDYFPRRLDRPGSVKVAVLYDIWSVSSDGPSGRWT